MANSSQARKRARQAVARRGRNIAFKTRLRTCQKRVVAALREKNQDKAKEAYTDFVKVADKVAGKGIVHPNKTARLKSRLNAALRRQAAS